MQTRTIKLNDGTLFMGKRIFNFWEGWGEVTYKVIASNTFAEGTVLKILFRSISYIEYEPKQKKG